MYRANDSLTWLTTVGVLNFLTKECSLFEYENEIKNYLIT